MGKILAGMIIVVVLLSCILLQDYTVNGVVTADNSWLTRAPLNQSRSDLGTAVANGKIYAIGESDVSC